MNCSTIDEMLTLLSYEEGFLELSLFLSPHKMMLPVSKETDAAWPVLSGCQSSPSLGSAGCFGVGDVETFFVNRFF